MTAPGYVYLPPRYPRAGAAPLPAVVVISDQLGSQGVPWDRELPQCLEWLTRRLTPAVPRPAQALQRS